MAARATGSRNLGLPVQIPKKISCCFLAWDNLSNLGGEAGESQVALPATCGLGAVDTAINGPCASRLSSGGPNRGPRVPGQGPGLGISSVQMCGDVVWGSPLHCCHKGDAGGPGSLGRYLCTGSGRVVAVDTVTHACDEGHG